MNNSAYYKQQAKSLMSNTWKTYALAYIIYVAINLAASATGIGSLVTLITAGSFYLGFSIIALKIISGKDIEAGNVFEGFSNFANALVLSLHQMLIVFLWSLLLIVPGILKALSYSMTYYVLAENPDFKSKQAMEESESLMEGHRWEFFKLQLSFLGWGILSLFTFGILLVWLTPYMGIATAKFYEDLKIQKYGTANPYGEENQEQPFVQQSENDIDSMLGQIQFSAEPTETSQYAVDNSAEELRFDDGEDS